MPENKKKQPERMPESRDSDSGSRKPAYRRRPSNDIAEDPKFKPPKAQKSMDTDSKDSGD